MEWVTLLKFLNQKAFVFFGGFHQKLEERVIRGKWGDLMGAPGTRLQNIRAHLDSWGNVPKDGPWMQPPIAYFSASLRWLFQMLSILFDSLILSPLPSNPLFNQERKPPTFCHPTYRLDGSWTRSSLRLISPLPHPSATHLLSLVLSLPDGFRILVDSDPWVSLDSVPFALIP